MDFSVIEQNWQYLLFGTFPDGPIEGALLTLIISLIAGIASIILGTLGGVALAMLRGFWMNLFAAFLGFFRAIPVIMLIFWTYFLLPIVFNADIPGITSVICALALITSAYLAHAVKAGILAIGQGQWQAGLSLGFSRWQVLWQIILPQALRMMVPSFINQWVALIKDTSLAYVVGVAELSFLANQVNNREMVYPMEVFLFVGFIYFIMCLTLEIVANLVAKRISRQNQSTAPSIKRSLLFWRRQKLLALS
ncbi:amino acid ABC transporter permease [Providencia stuartii]|uniref:Glutamate/aspartate import permease protein GltK n=2 Tax=Providencia TaxID=586 RepID=A0A1S1HNH1_PROST|nr:MULTISPECIES: amino acid ABC transporter permease [Providencia]MDV5227430.1 amino acid ABC transporter permease [Providencia rettgeri]ELR5113963.1 amino acid ABC transporter permease [Providencia stuartii]ELR5299940.1 amino acid ABC transporter permease [Providencia stuartii]ELR5302768.1 amino acid ABC transporter permease [Providencia stuartii]MDW7589047.1 amino acid ABC transporter permease [Providencia sp. 2023EL-00965]